MRFVALLMLGLAGLGLVGPTQILSADEIQSDQPWSVFRKNLQHAAHNQKSCSTKPEILARIPDIYCRQVILSDADEDGELDVIATGYKHNGIVAISGKKPHDAIWKFEADVQVWSVAAVAGKSVFFGSGDLKHEDKGHFHCLDLKSGKLKWKVPIKGGLIAASPVVIEGAVVFGAEDKTVYALDAETGKVRWKLETEEAISSSPAVSGGIIYIGSWDGSLYGLTARDGKKLFKTELGLWVHSSPTILDKTVFVGVSEPNSVVALSSETGKVLWKHKTEKLPDSSPTVHDGTVYCGEIVGDNLYAIAAADGKRLWAFPADGWTLSSPVVTGDTVVFGSLKGTLYGVSRKEGKELWKMDLESGIRGSAVIHEDRLYVSTDGGVLFIMGIRDK